MAFVRVLNSLVRDKVLGPRVVPIVPDESRTFGMEGMFRQLGIYSQVGQLYQPEDAGDFMYYHEDEDGQILQEGINEPGAFSSWLAAATSYANHGVTMIPFYIFYSMFGFQRVGDLAWAAGDSRARGFLIGGTSGRTTLNGEGLQHEDGHSHLLASTIPNCRAYDPTYAYELGVIVRDGLRRMCTEQEDVFYYLTVMNEGYVQPPLPEGVEDGILRGMYLLREGEGDGPRVQLLGSGSILREVIAGADLLASDHGVAADVWSVTSFTELRRDGIEVERWNRLHPDRRATRPVREQGVSASATRAVRGVHRLHAGVRRPDPRMGAGALHRARDGRVRAQRLPRAAAALLRGRPAPRGGRGARGAGPRRRGRAGGRAAGDRAVRDRHRERRALAPVSPSADETSLQNEVLCPRDALCTHAAASALAPICPHMGSPCVLASHAPIAPRRRIVILQ